ncbi:unnamed protein product [Acanthoscelides obtectus]|uniref:Uncharacterized protein n=1 Tax=Acanthoscelides obtectus TaxID=200917 RepID=A0A9P0JSE7_ACAOB|nr:unnamed protein product [Acanthoscelides obtectus]CAK1679363.1 hypothetical protein AOBTE_LOCUS32224 [Acanthoscelides obtectus]
MCDMDKLCICILISFISSVLSQASMNNPKLLTPAKPVEMKQNTIGGILPVKNNLTLTSTISPGPHQHHIVPKTGVSAVTDATHFGREHVTENTTKSHSSHEDKSSEKHLYHDESHERHSAETKSSDVQERLHHMKNKPAAVTLNSAKNQTTQPNVTAKTNNTQENINHNHTSTHSINISSPTFSPIVNRTIPKPVPTKPTRPVPEDINFILASKNAEHYAPCLEAKDSKGTKTSDIVVLVVAVIFSVPLVAIVVSILYKKWTDWWQHRNYRRMDFLIEGMYNN